MRGLIRKDLFLMKKSMGSTLLILAFLVILFSTMMGVASGMAMIPISFSILILSTFSYDEAAKWDTYVLSTPTAKRRVVLSKYLSALVMTVLGAVFSAITAVVVLVLRNETWSQEVTLTFLTSVGFACCMNAVLLPLVYRFGPERARIALMAVIFVPICLAALMRNQFSATIASLNETVFLSVLTYLPLFGALLLFVSYFISKAIYVRKDF